MVICLVHVTLRFLFIWNPTHAKVYAVLKRTVDTQNYIEEILKLYAQEERTIIQSNES